MRRIVLSLAATSLALILSYHVALSQISKGTVSAGISMSYGNDKQDFYMAGVTPAIYYFMSKKFAVGLIIPLSYGRQTGNRSFVIDTIYRYCMGPSFRYYIPLTSRLHLIPQIDLAFGFQKTNQISDEINNGTSYSSSMSSASMLRFGIGSSYLITKSVGIEGKIFWQSLHSSHVTVGENTAANIAIGLQYYFQKKG